ncbi:Stk1 family PASTA domain-containing Ser/Thr kinase [Peribacillus asahii]|uniref:Stk1 family PASTA domain-containing Ser/Thr kinase n=1 Tax=Peribacillus asahii TaxID=228899 RepID=UPI0037F9EE88
MLVGKRINDRYKLLKMVGGGGMANVYLARDMILDRDVALKILRMDFNNDEEFIKRFNREAQSATSLAHSNIVSIYDVGEEGDIYYIVMEYVEGMTLKQYIQKNSPIPIETALDIMKQITAAISHAHHNGIIHRDIKPQNILIDHEGTVKITDFGIAMALSATNITQTNAVLGSVHYLSPEQARGGMANKKSDIYSLGIVMFELLTGRLPFSGESAVSIALKHLQSETPSPKRWNADIPQSVENIILKATAKDSYYRYESVEAMGEDIRTALDPGRENEAPFFIPQDEEATKAIPIITNDYLDSIDETIVRGPEKNKPVSDHDEPTIASDKANHNKPAKQPEQEKIKRKKGPVILVASFLTLLFLTILIIVVFPSLLGTKEVAIPDLQGKELEDAITELQHIGLVPGKIIELEDSEIPEDHVIKTNPKEGKKVKEGAKIDIYQSIGQETIVLSDYEGENIEDIEKQLEKMEFKDIVVTEEYHADIASGTIISQNPVANTEVLPEDTVIEFTVSKGSEQILLKDLTGYSEAGLKDYAQDSGLIIEVEKEEYHQSVPEGQVISQSPAAHSSIDKGSTVKVVLSKGKEEVPPKTVTKEIMIEYRPDVMGKAQYVQIYVEDLTRTMDEPFDSFYMTENKKRTIDFTVSIDKPARYKVMRDDQVIIDEEVQYSD